MLKLYKRVRVSREFASDALIVAGAAGVGVGIHMLVGVAWTVIYAGVAVMALGYLLGTSTEVSE